MSAFVRRFPALRRARRLLFYAIVRLLAGGLERAPRGLAVAWMRGLGAVAWRLLRSERLIALRQVGWAFPELDERACEALARRSFGEFGENLVDSLRGDRPVSISSEARRRLECAAADERPVLVLTAHLGAFELLGRFLARSLAPLGVVTADPHNARLDGWFRRRRRAVGLRAFDRQDETLAAARWLRAGSALAVLADLRGAGTRVPAPWFGREAPTLVGPGRLAKRTQALILPVGIRREEEGHRVLVGDAVDWRETDDDRGLAARCNAALEALIRQAPEQWPWFHDRYGHGSGGREVDA
jgi:KDO2-lipid IV(A) lauroyltransferase